MAKRNPAWTVMLYLAGDKLTTECMFALTEMKHAAFGKHLNVVAQFDPSDPHLPTHRYHIKRRRQKKRFRHDIIDRAGYVGNNGEQFIDLFDFCDRLETRLADGVVVEQCRTVKEFLSNDFVFTSCYLGAAYQYSYGVSLYFPWSHVAPSYCAVSLEMNDLQTALEYCARATALLEANGQQWGAAEGKMNLGTIYHALCDEQKALELAKYSRWQSPYYWAGFVIQGQYEQKGQFTETRSVKFKLPCWRF